MPIEIVYLVMAFTGMYDDRTSWPVAVLFSEEEAFRYKEQAEAASLAELERLRQEQGGGYMYCSEPTRFDLGHEVRDSRVSYRVMPVPLVKGALSAQGLFDVADRFAHAEASTRARNFPQFANSTLVQVQPEPVDVRSDFAAKLNAALTKNSSSSQ